jgi:hypothetical protein
MPARSTAIMPPTRFHEALAALRVTQRQLARMLQCSYRLTADWGIGKQEVPPGVADWLEACVAVRVRHPFPEPPKDWRQRDPRFVLKRQRLREAARAAAENAALLRDEPPPTAWVHESQSKTLKKAKAAAGAA